MNAGNGSSYLMTTSIVLILYLWVRLISALITIIPSSTDMHIPRSCRSVLLISLISIEEHSRFMRARFIFPHHCESSL
ncbi:hypothetical protein F5890DRAFT_1492881, partial [Lentinula detonsa]